jgi:hypothetical protein
MQGLGACVATQRTAFYRKNPQLVNNFTSFTQPLVAHRKIDKRNPGKIFVAGTEAR